MSGPCRRALLPRPHGRRRPLPGSLRFASTTTLFSTGTTMLPPPPPRSRRSTSTLSSSSSSEGGGGKGKHLETNDETKRFTSNLQSLCRRGAIPNVCSIAENKLYRALNHLLPNGRGSLVEPNAVAFSIVIRCHAGNKQIDPSERAERAERVLRRLLECYQRDINGGELSRGGSRFAPNFLCYGPVVTAYGRSGTGVAGATKSEALMDEMERLHDETGDDAVRPNAVVYNAVADAWARSGSKSAPAKVRHVMERMNDKGLECDSYTYAALINAYGNRRDDNDKNNENACQVVQNVLDEIERLDVDNIRHRRRRLGNTALYTCAVRAWSNLSPTVRGVRRSLDVLTRMEDLYKTKENYRAKPTAATYTTVINHLARASHPQGGVIAEELLCRMDELASMGSDGARRDTGVMNAVVDAWARSGSADAGRRAEALVSNMKELYESGSYPKLRPDATTMNSLINAWTKSKDPNAPFRAEEALHRMGTAYLEGKTNVKPDALTYSAVLQSWAKSGSEGSPERAERLLRSMEDPTGLMSASSASSVAVDRDNNERREGCDRNIRTGRSLAVKPNVQCYEAVMDCWARSGKGVAAAERAESILRFLEEEGRRRWAPMKGGDDRLEPTRRTYAAAILAWARSGSKAMGARRAEALLDRMIDRNNGGGPPSGTRVAAYTAVISAWSSSGHPLAAEKAHGLLRRMQKRHQDGERDAKPNARSYTAVIHAYAKSSSSTSAEKAVELLNEMKERYRAGHEDLKPTLVTFNAVLDAIARGDDGRTSAEAAETMLREMERASKSDDALKNVVRPDTISYSAVVNGWARVGDGRRAEACLRRMDDLREARKGCNGGGAHLKPNAIVYTSVMNAYANSDDPHRAHRIEELLHEMERRARDDSDEGLRPTAVTYSTVIEAFVKCGDGKYLEKAKYIFESMVDRYDAGEEDVKPPSFIVDLLREACASAALGELDAVGNDESSTEKMC